MTLMRLPLTHPARRAPRAVEREDVQRCIRVFAEQRWGASPPVDVVGQVRRVLTLRVSSPVWRSALKWAEQDLCAEIAHSLHTRCDHIRVFLG